MLTRAINSSKHALDIVNPDEHHVLYANILFNLATAYHQRFYYADDLDSASEALKLYRNSLDYMPKNDSLYVETISRIEILEKIAAPLN